MNALDPVCAFICVIIWTFEQKTSDAQDKSRPVSQARGGASTPRPAAELAGGLEELKTITFYPLTSWKNVPTSGELVSRLAERRRRYGWRVDFDGFKLPFMQNVAEKLAQMSVE